MLSPIEFRHSFVRFYSHQVICLILVTVLVGFLQPTAHGQALSQEVTYPNDKIAFICGPQLRARSSLNPAPWFDSTALNMGITLGDRTPRIPPFGPMTFNASTGGWDNVIAGRVNIDSGSIVVTGVGTAFTKDVDPNGSAPNFNGHLRIRDEFGIERSVAVMSVESDTSLTLTSPWPYGSASNTVADTYYQQVNYNANTESYYSDNYYDLALVQYINYYRTGDPRFLAYARKTADTWWHSQQIKDGTVTGGPSHLPPRSMAFAGLMLRAMDGRPEMWDYIEREVGASFDNWVYQRKSNTTLYYDLREDGYAQLYAVLLAKVLPDNYLLYGNGTLNASTGEANDGPTKRAAYLAKAEDTAVNFFGRLQRPDGSWRWDVDLTPDPSSQMRDVEQPFMVGLYLESLILVHQLSTSPSTRAALVNQLTKAVRHLYNDTYQRTQVVTDMPQYRWRGTDYFWGGGVVSNPTYYSPPPPLTTANGDTSTIRQARHLQSTIPHAFGYAYFVTGDPIYKTMGDEVFDSSYGDSGDGIHCLADSGKGKDYAMNYRASGRYLVWRLGGSANPTPTPSPTPAVGALASFVGVDTTTQGNWQGVYGVDGHNVINDSAAYPSYVQVTPNSQTSYVWAENSSDSRALQKTSSSERIAACWYSSSMFSVDVNFTDNQVHQLALYGLDWDSDERVQRIDILDATYNTVLDSRTLSSFGPGKYLVWNLRGHVRINVIGTSGMNGVISGLFFGPLTAAMSISPASVNRARLHAGNLVDDFPLPNSSETGEFENSNVDAALTSSLEGLTTDIELAYRDFNDERSMFGAVTQIESQLWAAIAFSRSQAALAARTGATTSVRNHLVRIASHLAMAEDLMRTGAISSTTADQAAAVNARIDVLLGPAHAGYGLNTPAQLAPLSLGSVFGDETLSPLSPQTLFATVGSDGFVPYELAGVNVTVAGKAVPVTYVSPSRVSFYVAPDVAQGSNVEVIVTSQDGFVSRGITTIAPNVTRLMTATGNEDGTAIALNDSRHTVAGFDAITPENFGPDKRTRVTIYATGISGSAINSDATNDITIAGLLLRPNFAEAVMVEARLSNGTVINLPVEFAGTQGLLPGLDQVNIVLTSELAGAGTVELTLIVGGQRSNAPTIVVQ